MTIILLSMGSAFAFIFISFVLVRAYIWHRIKNYSTSSEDNAESSNADSSVGSSEHRGLVSSGKMSMGDLELHGSDRSSKKDKSSRGKAFRDHSSVSV